MRNPRVGLRSMRWGMTESLPSALRPPHRLLMIALASRRGRPLVSRSLALNLREGVIGWASTERKT